jgi:diguanylate cyclase (GGDEF)-like protein
VGELEQPGSAGRVLGKQRNPGRAADVKPARCCGGDGLAGLLDAVVSAGPVDVGWCAAAVLLATAAWQPARTAVPVARRATGRLVIAMPIAFACLALGVLVAGGAGHLNAVAITLATGSPAAVMLRLILSFQQHAEMLNASRREANTDPLTGLANRRHLMADLEPLDGDCSRERALLLFDLNGFKAYNDTFGHAAADQLLAQLGQALHDAVGADGRAYRLGGDEFCVLLHNGADLDALIARTLAALTVDGPGFAITTAFGAARLPHDATCPWRITRTAAPRRRRSRRAGRRGHAG